MVFGDPAHHRERFLGARPVVGHGRREDDVGEVLDLLAQRLDRATSPARQAAWSATCSAGQERGEAEQRALGAQQEALAR